MTSPSFLPHLSGLAPVTQAQQLLLEWQHSHPQAATPDAALQTRLQALCEALLQPPAADINVDEYDIRATILGAAAIDVVTAAASGPKRGARALAACLHSLRLPLPLQPYGRVLLSISSPATAELEMDELTEITEAIQHALGPETDMIFGHGVTEPAAEPALTIWLLAATHHAPATVAPARPAATATAAPARPAALPPPALAPDPAFTAAAYLVLRHGYGSTALLQRHLHTGYNRSGYLLEQLAQANIISQPTTTLKRYPALITSETQLLALLAQLLPQP